MIFHIFLSILIVFKHILLTSIVCVYPNPDSADSSVPQSSSVQNPLEKHASEQQC